MHLTTNPKEETMNTGKRAVFYYLSFVLGIIFAGNCFAQEPKQPTQPEKTYSMNFALNYATKQKSEFHVFYISENGKEAKIWNIQINNDRNLYKLNNFKENVYYRALILSFGNKNWFLSDIILFLKPTNSKVIIKSIPIKQEKQKNAPPPFPRNSPKKYRI